MDRHPSSPMENNTIICKNCGNHFTGKFCNQCGEKAYRDQDRKILHLLGEAFHFITHFEGTFFTTLKTIFSAPGKVSADYCYGIRKKYFKPLSLFLLLVVLYLLFPLAVGLNMPLHYHMTHDQYGSFAGNKVQAFLEQHPDITFSMLQEKFAAKSEKLSKLLLLLILPCCALILWALSFLRRRFFFDQMVLSAEINSFFLIINFFLMPVLISLVHIAVQTFHFSVTWLNDRTYTYTGQIITAIFTAFAMNRFYHFKWPYSVIATAIFIYFHGIIVYSLYKFALFVVVFYQIH